MAKMTGARYIAEILKGYGVTHVFFMPAILRKALPEMEKLGIRPERLQLEWISAAEGPRFVEIMQELEKLRSKVTKEEIEYTQKALAEREKEKAKAA